jgi:hypothetical protein
MRLTSLWLVGLWAGCVFDRSGVSAASHKATSDGGETVADLSSKAEARRLDSTDVHRDLDLSTDGAPDMYADIQIADALRPDGPWPDGAQPDTLQPDLSSPDVKQGPLVIEAESYTTKKSLDGTYSWVVQSDIANYSGSGFIVASPGTPDMNCQANYTTCGAQADYDFSVAAPATHIHFRFYSEDGDSNSVQWGIDGVHQGQVGWSPHLTWTFATTVKSLAAGPHKLTLWMRENNARVDRIVISDTATPPGS